MPLNIICILSVISSTSIITINIIVIILIIIVNIIVTITIIIIAITIIVIIIIIIIPSPDAARHPPTLVRRFRSQPVPLDRDQGLSVCGLLRHRVA